MEVWRKSIDLILQLRFSGRIDAGRRPTFDFQIFTEGFDTTDLKEAKALLNELS